MIKVSTRQFCVICGAIVLLANGERIMANTELSSRLGDKRAESDRVAKIKREDARQLQKLSEVALERAQAGCELVYNRQTKKYFPFTEGDLVKSAIPPHSPLPNRLVCSDRETAETDSTGRIAAGSIARVAPKDLDKYKQYLEGKNAAKDK